jgi:hypothetical protein
MKIKYKVSPKMGHVCKARYQDGSILWPTYLMGDSVMADREK